MAVLLGCHLFYNAGVYNYCADMFLQMSALVIMIGLTGF